MLAADHEGVSAAMWRAAEAADAWAGEGGAELGGRPAPVMELRPKGRLRGVAVALLATVLGCGEPASEPGAEGPAQSAAGPERADENPRERPPDRVRSAQEKAADEADADARSIARLQRVAWWNEPTMVDGLELGERNRAALDRLLAEQVAVRRQAERERRDAERELPAALLAGDVERAERLRSALGEAARGSVDAELGLRLRGFALLDPEQRARIGELYPHLAERPWIAPLRPRAGAIEADASGADAE